LERQKQWVEEELPHIQEQVKKDGGVLLYSDEVVFHVAGSMSRTWAEKGVGIEVPSMPGRESVKALGAVSVDANPKFHFQFSEVFNQDTYLQFLKRVASRYDVKIHMIVDNAKYHHGAIVAEWLESYKAKIELHFLPPYSPDLNAQECVWRLTRRKGIHNRYFDSKKSLHHVVFRQFNRFQGNPAHLRGAIRPFLFQGNFNAT
jgi:transposase